MFCAGNERYAIDELLLKKAEAAGLKPEDKAFAEYMDKNDPLVKFRQMFHMPRNDTLMGGAWVVSQFAFLPFQSLTLSQLF